MGVLLCKKYRGRSRIVVNKGIHINYVSSVKYYVLGFKYMNYSFISTYNRTPGAYMIDEDLKLRLYKLGEKTNKPFYQKLGFYEKFVESFPEIKSAGPEDFCFFVSRRGKYGYLSNFLIEKGGHFGEDGILFRSSEHELMFLKAKTFSDARIMRLIVQADDPAEAKRLGREVSGYEERVWREKRYNCLLQSVWHKFSQDNELTKLLLSTGDKYIAEAAGYDDLFGLGLWEFTQGDSKGCKIDETTFDVYPENWPGLNLLGVALMDVRSRLRNNPSTASAASVQFNQENFTGFYGYYFSRALDHQ